MTARTSVLLMLFTLAVCLLLIAVSTSNLRTAGTAADAAAARFTQVSSDAERVRVLRGRSQTIAAGEQPEQDIFRRVNETLAAAGLARTRVQSVNPAGDRALDTDSAGGAARRIQTVRVVLEPITLDELGAFLDRWRQDQALWTITGIDCSIASSRGVSVGSYRAALTASAVYIPSMSSKTSTITTITPASTSP